MGLREQLFRKREKEMGLLDETKKIQEQKTQDMIQKTREEELRAKLMPRKATVRQIVELIHGEKYCYITKGGKITYFEGKLKNIPECLLNLDMLEISLKPKSDEFDIGLYVYPNELLDLLNIGVKNLCEAPKNLYDDCYNSYATKENPILTVLEEIEKSNIKQNFEEGHEELLESFKPTLDFEEGIEELLER